MKRKVNQASTSRKKQKLSTETAQKPKADFLAGITCFIHPANFGAGRLNIFQRLIKNNGGELCDTLSPFSEELTHIIFEESLDIDKIKKLLDPSDYANIKLINCSWLSACSKSKTKVDTKDYEIEIVTYPSKTKISKSTSSGNTTVKVSSDVLQEASSSSALVKETVADTQNAVTSLPKTLARKTTNKIHESFSGDVESTPISSTKCDIQDVQDTGQNISKEEVNEKKDDDKMQGEGLRKESSLRKFVPQNIKEKFACAQPSSSKVKNHNDHITAELEKLAAAYKSKKDTWRALGYQKAISAIRNYPRTITSREEALSIRGIGGRLADKVAEIVESGKLRKVAAVCEDEEAKALQLFMGVWGAGPTTAQTWYTQGYRTLEDLQQKANLSRHQQIGLKYYDDINSCIPRTEVVEIENYVRSAALSIKKGLVVMVCGSYRRGKATCGDVDVLLTHPDGQSHESIFHPLLNKLRETGFLTDDLVTQEDNGAQKKYLGVCKLPGDGQKKLGIPDFTSNLLLSSLDNLPFQQHRRLDVIVVPYQEFAPALMYFTGSAHFNRSMRLLAIKMGMSLSEHGLRTGIIRQKGEKLTQGRLLETPTEESIFKLLGLEYRSPEERDH